MTAPCPGRSSADERVFERLFASAGGVAQVSAFWRAKFSALGEQVSDPAWSSPWLRRILEIPDRPLNLAEADRVGATDAVVTQAGCLVSFAEICKATMHGSDVDRTRSNLIAVLKGAPNGTAQESSRLLRLVRETFDAVRRLHGGERLARRFYLETSEILALLRQETAFVMPPTTDTYEFAPLVATGQGCRAVSTTWQGVPSFNHDHLNTSYRCVDVRPVMDAQVGKTMRFDLAFYNFLYSGLDVLAAPALPHGDELFAIAYSAWTSSNAPSSPRRAAEAAAASVHPNAKGDLSILAIGLLMGQVASEDGVPKRSVETLLEEATQRAVALVDAHPAKLVGEHVVLESAGKETDLILSEMCRWYASRSKWRTLLPIQVQASRPDLASGSMSPLLTYLRFHTGDEIFVGILLRLLAEMKSIRNGVTPPQDKHAREVVAAIKHIAQRPPVMPIDDMAKIWLERVWKKLGRVRPPNAFGGETNRAAWRHLGLAKEWVGQAAWLQQFASNPETHDAGLVVKELLAAADEVDLYPYFEACIRHVHIDDLVPKIVLPANRQAIANSHSFDRYRAFLRAHGVDRAV